MRASTLNRKVIAYTCDQLLMNDESTMNVKRSWEHDLGVQLDDLVQKKNKQKAKNEKT